MQYLLIDSLCIIQEDKSNPFDKDKGQDFKKEAERMERVFRSAYATLAACCASSSAEPFLKPRRARPCVTMQAGEALYYLCDAINDFSGDVEQAPETRGAGSSKIECFRAEQSTSPRRRHTGSAARVRDARH